jgi:biopolymer transport protein ExbD
MHRGHGKRRLFGKSKKPRESGELALQITSMADIFTILLVFLLKGIASDTIQIAPSNETKLPVGVHTAQLNESALQVELSKTGILVEKEFLMALDSGRMPASLTAKDGIIPALNERLSKERERQKIINQANDSVKIDSRVIVMADEAVPYATIKPILKTLSANGYSEIKFAVVNDH